MLSEVHQPASEIDAKLQRGHASGRALGNVAKRVEGLPIAGHAFAVGPSHVSLVRPDGNSGAPCPTPIRGLYLTRALLLGNYSSSTKPGEL